MAPTSQQSKAAKAKILAGAKTPKARVQRYLKSTESKLTEGAKSALLLSGPRCSHAMSLLLRDLRAMLAPHCKLLTKRNAVVAFEAEGQHSLEFLTTKNDCALLAMASHNKKRPNNLVLGRTFDRQILDLVELGVLRFKSMKDYGGSVPKKRVGSKPLMLFVGDLWQHDETCAKLQNLLIDFYRGDPVDKLVASGLDHVICFTIASEGSHHSKPIVHQRTYFCKLKKNPDAASKVPLPYLSPCGPDMDFEIRRTQFADPDLWKASLKQPAAAKSKKVKNKSTNLFGETIGRLHMEKQNIDKMQGRKAKALRRAEKLERESEKEALESELGREKESMEMEFRQTYGFDEEETERKHFPGKK